mmetsp:Transcript_11792/g.25185  ORF Transcript_11792/g.25185 Transcript_11792/m.25185 type:complete len:92 (-) Transcript_11792:832-1107(-)
MANNRGKTHSRDLSAYIGRQQWLPGSKPLQLGICKTHDLIEVDWATQFSCKLRERLPVRALAKQVLGVLVKAVRSPCWQISGSVPSRARLW